MNESSCTNLAKCLLMFTGVCYLISAGGLSYVGIWAFSTYDHFDEIADATITLFPASIILGVSAFMCIIGILAFVAAFRSNKILLSVFFCLILLVFVGEVVASILGLVYRNQVEDVLEDDLINAVNKYNLTAYKEQMDFLQQKFACCGVHRASDWENSEYWKMNHTDTVPTSCCNVTFVTCNATLNSDTIYQEGCLDKLNSEFSQNLIYLTGTAIFLVVVQFLALLSTCILVCRTREEQQYQSLIEDIGGHLTI
ncbi:unnamed protein product [Candidula unifasciata]|uniref:Tetraspanin n=1 Tax=Candidula unifasciata TaxID=100452 RepID=A0A8S3YWF2_9EUPU|nr:unnamed protein product [Candidula unifasciata]